MTDHLPENKYMSEHPLKVVQNGTIIVPEITSDSLVLDSRNISSVWLNTLNYLHVKSLSIKNNPLIFMVDVYSLHTLNCSNCKLTALPTYMPVLTNLNCSNNLLTSLPNYQQLTTLDCSDNIITKLPSFPKLKSLTINNNPIHEINIPTLTYLEAYGCPIFIIFDIPGLIRRSSLLDRFGSFKWVTSRTEKINSKTILLNWTDDKPSINPILYRIFSKSRFWKRALNFLFSHPKKDI